MILEKVVESLKSKYKDEVILGLAGDDNQDLRFIPTGLVGLEAIIGRPGIPAWKLTQICGFEDTGKSLLGLWFLKEFQARYKRGLPVLIDSEDAFDKDFFRKLGGDPKKLVITTPKSVEQMFRFIWDLVDEVRGNYSDVGHIFVVIDSISTAVESELSGEGQVGIHARTLHREFRKIRAQLRKWDATLVYISQNREKVTMGPYGGGTARLGGHAVDFAPVLTLELKKSGIDKDSEGDPVSVTFRVKCAKNHVAIPFKEADLLFDLKTFRFRNGLNLLRAFLKMKKVIRDKGWLTYEGKKYREKNLIEVLESDPSVEDEVRKFYGIEYDYRVLKEEEGNGTGKKGDRLLKDRKEVEEEG